MAKRYDWDKPIGPKVLPVECRKCGERFTIDVPAKNHTIEKPCPKCGWKVASFGGFDWPTEAEIQEMESVERCRKVARNG